MRLLHLVPSALLVALAEAVVNAFPSIVAEREGGMGLGSALIVGRVAHVGALALGAVAAAWAADRGWTSAAFVAGGLLFGAGTVGVATQPMHALDWVIVASALAGAGVGAILTTAFAAAARLAADRRPFGIALLLVAPFVGNGLIGLVVAAGGAGLAVCTVAGVGLSVAAAWVLRASTDGRAPATPPESDPRRISTGAALVGGILVGAGIVTAIAAADPSRVSAVLLARPLGLADLDALDAARAWMVAVGLVAALAGALLLLLPTRPSRHVATAVPALALVSTGAAGALAALRFAGIGGGGSRVDDAIVAAAVGGAAGLAGIAVGGWWLGRGAEPRAPATVGSALVAAGAGVAFVVATDGALEPGLVRFATIAAVAVGGALAAVALRTVLADVSAVVVGLAAASGVIAAAAASMLGSMVGTGEALRSVTGEADSAGGVILVAAAVGAAVASASLPPRRRTGA